MAQKQIKIASQRNPFAIDKTKSAADLFLAPPPSDEATDDENTENDKNVHNVHNVHFTSKEENLEPSTVSEDTTIENQETSKPSEPVVNEKKKHIHLVLAQDTYHMLEKMAGLQHLTVTKCISEMIESSYIKKWKGISEQLDQITKKLEKRSPKDGPLSL